MTHVTCRLTAKNRDQLRNPTLGNRVRASFTSHHNTTLHAVQLDSGRRQQLSIDIFHTRARCSEPPARRCCYRSTGQTDGRTDIVPLHRRSSLEAGNVNRCCGTDSERLLVATWRIRPRISAVRIFRRSHYISTTPGAHHHCELRCDVRPIRNVKV